MNVLATPEGSSPSLGVPVPRGRDAIDEVEQRRRHAFAAMRVQRFGGEPPGDSLPKHAVAPGPEVPPDDHRVRPAPPEPVVDRLDDAVGVAAASFSAAWLRIAM